MLSPEEQRVLEYLQGFLTPERQRRFEEILARRTRMLTVVLEDVYQPQNLSAVLRTAEACGLQDVHLIESENQVKVDRNVSMGSDRWLTIHRHQGTACPTQDCLLGLKESGYRILLASAHPPAMPLDDLEICGPTALLIGHETKGHSDVAGQLADQRVTIPLRGFVESLNLSVATALILSHLRSSLERSELDWHLSQHEVDVLTLEWTRKSIKHVDEILERFHKEIENNPREPTNRSSHPAVGDRCPS